MAEAFHIDPNDLLENYTRAQVDLMLYTHNWAIDSATSKDAGDRSRNQTIHNFHGDNKGAADAISRLGVL